MADLLQHGLYAITDPDLLPGTRLLQGVEAALRGGAAMVQYRDKSAAPAVRRQRAQELIALCRAWRRPLIINDDLALAVAIGADGVHLGQEDAGPARARRELGPNAIVGVTCHQSLTLAQQAKRAGASYLAFGRFFASRTKNQAPAADLAILGQARTLQLPVVAIGGITLENAPDALQAGADWLAVINGLFGQPDIEATSSRFRTLICNHERESIHDPI